MRKHRSLVIAQVAKTLRKRYGDFSHYNRRNPLDELLFIICSIQTDEKKYRGSYKSLKRKFPRFDLLGNAQHKEIAKPLAKAGLSNVKATALRKILDEILNRFGRITLSPLRQMDSAECEEFLTSLPTVGKKTARCVMMYSLGQQVFPVDVHCWRICKRLGWIRPTKRDGTCSQRDMDRLQHKIPTELRYSLHVNFVSLGREICTPRNPNCDICPISKACRKVGILAS